MKVLSEKIKNTRFDRARFTSALIALWILLWLFFLAREDKDGQYRELSLLLGEPDSGKPALLMGRELTAMTEEVTRRIQPGVTYTLHGFEKYSIDEVRARYYLWPLRRVEEGGDIAVVYAAGKAPDGYVFLSDAGPSGAVYIRKGLPVSRVRAGGKE